MLCPECRQETDKHIIAEFGVCLDCEDNVNLDDERWHPSDEDCTEFDDVDEAGFEREDQCWDDLPEQRGRVYYSDEGFLDRGDW